MPTAAPDSAYRYDPALIFNSLGPASERPWHILYIETGRERTISERAYALGWDCYYPQGMHQRLAGLRRALVASPRPVWGSYLAASWRDADPARRSWEAVEELKPHEGRLAGIDGVIDILRDHETHRPWSLDHSVIWAIWRQQSAGDFDEVIAVETKPVESKRSRRRNLPRWVQIGHAARIIGGIAAQLGLSVGVIADLARAPEIGLDVSIFGRTTRIWSPLAFLQKCA